MLRFTIYRGLTMTDRGLTKGLAAVLLVTVASQIFYIAVVSGSENEMLRPLTWFTELFAFSISAIFAHALAVRRPVEAALWSTIALAGVLNVIQVGMGLSMFAPAMEAREAVPQLFAAILSGAFFFYFLAKLLLGGAALVLGFSALSAEGALAKGAGGLAALAGLAAIGLSLAAMVDSESWTFPAGAAGTAVTALLALVLLVRPQPEVTRAA
ncbi:thiamine biosynthesis protein ThiC [Qipengyuania sp. 1NDW9]|uniref:thiamine biosynthesis protein ThiC n=1 Tax=Qipengyuania xiapuensis TaxID=2867236 RepID=UPI001C871616|nr:thiamine biosynthesis protein ThiC [Qipengyuania xiapuensis]MBX7493432.1 thiamine biosynthesis protein ThiC [Qipengyuania xiapuensis]